MIKQLCNTLKTDPRFQDQPKGRDLTGQQWLDTLNLAIATQPKNNIEAKIWQDILLTQTQNLPFPVAYETNEDLTWSKNKKGRLLVHFNGLSKYRFEIYCDQRQLKYFQRFYDDQQIKRSSKNQHSSALFTLRSGRIAWQQGTGKRQPWEMYRNYRKACIHEFVNQPVERH